MENIILLPDEEPTASSWVSNIGKILNSDTLVLPDEPTASNFPMDGWNKTKVEDYPKLFHHCAIKASHIWSSDVCKEEERLPVQLYLCRFLAWSLERRSDALAALFVVENVDLRSFLVMLEINEYSMRALEDQIKTKYTDYFKANTTVYYRKLRNDPKTGIPTLEDIVQAKLDRVDLPKASDEAGNNYTSYSITYDDFEGKPQPADTTIERLQLLVFGKD